MAANVVLLAPAVLWILGPDIARRVLEFITDGTICAIPVDKILLDGEPSSPAQQPVATAKPLPQVTKAFGETLRAINDDVSVIEALPFPTATALRCPKISVLREVQLCGGLVINFPGEELILSDHHDEE
uniref:Uncharacterized protein n=1 Tax=Romanomermis culicivorax TaxID=13658 RepID=A0A915L535_ROMCU